MAAVIKLGGLFIIGMSLGALCFQIGRRLAFRYEGNSGDSIPSWNWKCLTIPRLFTPWRLNTHLRWQILIELAAGLLLAFSWRQIGFQLEWIMAILFICMLLIIFVTDLLAMIIPNRVLLFFLPFFIVLRVAVPLNPWWFPLAGAFAGFSIILAIILVSRGGMGAGDMKLFGVLGIVLGLDKVLLAFFLACLGGAVIGIALQVSGKIERGKAVPFGPYIAASAIISYFFGEKLIALYEYLWHGGMMGIMLN